jgi:hypothetical protein
MALRKLLPILALLPACLGVACTAAPEEEDGSGAEGALAEESGPADPGAAQGRDASGSYATQVWKVTRAWSDINPATGQDFEKDYSDWIASLQKTKSFRYGETITIKTPAGAPYERELDAPTLECADTALFLRVAYASIMSLPFYVKSGDLFAGHFGMIKSSGQPHGTYGTTYRKYANNADWRDGQPWPSDRVLRGRHAQSYSSGDETFVEEVPGKKGGAGAWFDEFFVNKRVGYFLVNLIDLFGSVNLAQEGNMFHIVPEATSPGDALLHRHGKYAPIGHTLFVYQSRTVRPGRMSIEIVSGSMPARQPSWEPDYQSRSYFLSAHGGGPETVEECKPGYNLDWENRDQCTKQIGTMDKASDASCAPPWQKLDWDDTKCVKYSVIPAEKTDLRKMGGGIRRFRTPVFRNGRWSNIVPMNARDIYIPDTDLERVGARVAKFAELLDLGTPEERKSAAIATIESARDYIRSAPSTCSKRSAREEAFQDLYRAYNETGEYDTTKIDSQHRTVEDYVFAELDYDTSRTCCWNSTKREHYDTIMQWAQAEMQKADDAQTCKAPPVFKATGSGDGYTAVRAFARANNLPFPDAWSEDEPCKAKDSTDDHLTDRAEQADYCKATTTQP